MTCQKCVDLVRNTLTGIDGIENIDISLENNNVIVETNLPYFIIQEKIEQSGKKAVLKGYGGNIVYSALYFSSIFIK